MVGEEAEAVAGLVQNLDLGGISGSYNTVNVNQQHGHSLEDLRRLVQNHENRLGKTPNPSRVHKSSQLLALQ